MIARLPSAAVAAMVLVLAAPGQQLPGDWAERDLDGKWVVYHRDCEANANDADRKKKWAALLRSQSEFEVLECIGIYEGWRFAGPMLQAANAPQAFRVALWNLGAFDSHNKDSADKALLGRPAEALQWFASHPLAQRGKGKSVLDRLAGEPATGAIAQLPPLDVVQVLIPALDAPAELAEFGDLLRAEPRVVYVHQVLRALDGVLVYGDVDSMLVPKVVALGRHRHERVRAAAIATLTKMPGDLLPDLALSRQANGSGDAEARRLATVALSYAAHPRAFFALLQIAADPEHPGAEVARSRLVDLGDPSTPWLLDLQGEGATAPSRERLGETAANVRTKLAKRSRSQVARSWVERAAWLRVMADPRAIQVRTAITGDLQQHFAANDLQGLLDRIRADPPRNPFRGDEVEAMRRAIREVLRDP